MKTTYPVITERNGYHIGSPHRRHWQFALLAGIGLEAVIALVALMAMMAAMVTL